MPLTGVLGDQLSAAELAVTSPALRFAGVEGGVCVVSDREVRRGRAQVAVGVERAHGERVVAIGGERDGGDLAADDALGLAVLEEQVADEPPAVGGAGLPGERGGGVGDAQRGDQRGPVGRACGWW